MRKITFLRSLLAILLLAVSTGYAWAETLTFDFAISGTIDGLSTASGKRSNDTFTIDGYTFNAYGCYKNSTNKYLMVEKSVGELTLPALVNKKITAISVLTGTGASKSVKVALYDGETLLEQKDLNAQDAVFTWNVTDAGTGTRYMLKVTNNKNAQFQNIVITYEEAGSATKPTLSVGAINFGTIMKGDVASEAVAVQANNFAGDVTYTYAITDGADAFAVDAAGNVSVIATAFGTYEGELSVTATDGTNELTKTAGLSVVVRELYEPANGTYAIKYGNYYMKNEVYSSHYVAATEFESSASLTDEYKFIITGVEGGYTIQNLEGSYVGIVTSGSYRNLKPQLTDAVVWTFYKGADGAVEAYCEDVDANYYMAFVLYNNTTPEFTAESSGGNFPTFEYIEEAQVIVADPVFSHEAGEVVFGTEVTLTAAEGAVITYSVNDGPTQTSEGNTATVVIDRPEVEIYAFASIGEVLSEGVTYTYNATLPITFSHPEGGVLPGTVVTIETLPGATLLGTITVNGVETEFAADANTYEVTINEATEIYVMAGISSVTAEATVNYTIASESEATFDFTDPDSFNPVIEKPAETSSGTELGGIEYTSGAITFVMDNNDANSSKLWYTTSELYELRVYNGNIMTISAANAVITSIVFESTNNTLGGINADGYANGTWTGSASSVDFSITASVRISTITVTYELKSSYEENIVCGAMYYMKPSEEWLAAAAGYAARFVNKNVDTELTIAGELLGNGYVAFYIPAVTRASSDYTHVTFSYVDGEGNTVAQTAEQTYPGYGYAFDVAGDNWIDISTSIDGVEVAGGIAYTNGVVTAEGAIEVYNVGGAIVARGNDNVDLRALNAGVYIVRNGNQVRKVVR